MNAQGQRNVAQFKRLLAADPTTTRMAGAALALLALPGTAAMFDDYEDPAINELGAGLFMGAGTEMGRMIGYDVATLDDEAKAAYIKEKVDKLKAVAKGMDPREGANYFGEQKTKLMDEFSSYGGSSHTKRQARGAMLGAALGALATAYPGYKIIQGDPVEN